MNNDIKISTTYKLNIKNQEFNLTQDEVYALYKQLSNALGLREFINAPDNDKVFSQPYIPYNPYNKDWTYPSQTWCYVTNNAK